MPVSGFLLEHGGNIEEAAQYNDHATGLFFMRVQFACRSTRLTTSSCKLGLFAEPSRCAWKLHATMQPMKTVIMVSKEGHCLNDLLFRWSSQGCCNGGCLRHRQQPPRVLPIGGFSYNVPFHHVPVTAATKAAG
jgi:formyltetrahydrofolate deformylase